MKLHIIQCCPDDKQFYWQSYVQLANAKELGTISLFRNLIFTPPDRQAKGVNPKWKELEKVFPEAHFSYYFDENEIMRDISRTGYIPLLRPYMLARHFKDYPELSNDAIFYIDADVLFNKPLDWIDKYIQDDINYLSDTKSYLNSDYFDSKIKDVKPEKLEDYKKIDVLDILAKAFNIDRKICEENKDATGGAQSLLKNVDYKFWQDVYDGSIFIRLFLRRINVEYFPSEDKGFQSWAADMWSLLFNLWKRGRKTVTPRDMDFCWATDSIKRLETTNIFHNAGITSESTLRSSEPDSRTNGRVDVICPAFFKSKREYVNNIITPFEDDEYLDNIISNPISAKFATWWYTNQVKNTKIKYNL